MNVLNQVFLTKWNINVGGDDPSDNGAFRGEGACLSSVGLTWPLEYPMLSLRLNVHITAWDFASLHNINKILNRLYITRLRSRISLKKIFINIL